MQELERDPLFKMDDIHDISKSELRERTMEKVQCREIALAESIGLTRGDKRYYSSAACFITFKTSLSRHLKSAWKLSV